MSNIIEFNFKDATYKEPEQPIIFNFIGNVFTILGGKSNNFISIWADESATKSNLKVYIASTGNGASLSIVDLSTKVLIDNYTETKSGAFNENLVSDDIVDLNIGPRG